MGVAGGLGGAASGAAMGAAFGPIGMGVGALAGGLLGGLAGPDGGGGSSSGARPGAMPGAYESPTNQIVNLDVTNNNVGSPININLGGTQTTPDGSIGNPAGRPVALPVSYAEYGSLDYQSRMAFVDELGNPVFHDGVPFGSELAPSQSGTGLSLQSALPFVLVGLAALVMLKRRRTR